MNLFYLSKDPKQSAAWLFDKHVVKMILECAQMLFAVWRTLDEDRLLASYPEGELGAPYRKTHVSHPVTVWAKSSAHNYDYVCEQGLAICAEYERRFFRRHACTDKLAWLQRNAPFQERGDFLLHTEPPKCVDERLKGIESPIDAYRAYYHMKAVLIGSYINAARPEWLSVRVPLWAKADRKAKKCLVGVSEAPLWGRLASALSAHGIQQSDVVAPTHKRKRADSKDAKKRVKLQ